MHIKYGKIYQNNTSKEIKSFLCSSVGTDHQEIRKVIGQGYHQVIFNSSVMISLIEHFLLVHNSSIAKIEFIGNEHVPGIKIKNLLDMMKHDRAYWSILKETLVILGNRYCVDIKCVELDMNSISQKYPKCKLALFNNGVIALDNIMYDEIAREVVGVMMLELN